MPSSVEDSASYYSTVVDTAKNIGERVVESSCFRSLRLVKEWVVQIYCPRSSQGGYSPGTRIDGMNFAPSGYKPLASDPSDIQTPVFFENRDLSDEEVDTSLHLHTVRSQPSSKKNLSVLIGGYSLPKKQAGADVGSGRNWQISTPLLGPMPPLGPLSEEVQAAYKQPDQPSSGNKPAVGPTVLTSKRQPEGSSSHIFDEKMISTLNDINGGLM